jgi:predicted phosphodiesterase
MDIQIFSDFHGEAYDDPAYIWKYVTPQADVAVVAGDIHSRRFEDAVNEIATKFKLVIVLLGNHEWYRRDISWEPDRTQFLDNVVLLDPGVYEYEDVTFIGATLWSDLKNEDPVLMLTVRNHINDFRVIRNGDRTFTPQDAVKRHHKEVKFLNKMVEKHREKKIVIITHFMPSFELVHPKWHTPGTALLNHYFAANCDDLVEKSEAAAWIFGHTHDRRDMDVRGVRCVCNPIGYPRENPDYQDMVIKV